MTNPAPANWLTTTVLAAVLLSACSAGEPTPPAGDMPLQANHYGSMAPSNTELIYALDADDKLVAVCNQCDFPTAAKGKPQIGSFTALDAEKALQLKPDMIFLVDGQEAIAETIKKQSALHCQPLILHNKRVRDIAQNVSLIGACTHHEKQADKLFRRFITNLDELAEIIALSDSSGPKVFFCVWPQPLTTVGKGSYLNEAITICGGDNVAVNLEQAYPQYNVEQLLKDQPDLIVLPNEAQDQDFMKRPPWTSLKAVANKKVYFLPPRDQDRLSRPTLRILPGLCWLAQRCHPELADKIKAYASRSLREE